MISLSALPGLFLFLSICALTAVAGHYLTSLLILLHLTERERDEGSENECLKLERGKMEWRKVCVCWCLCVIKVCEGRGPCSRGQIDWRHVNYRRQATCVTFLSSVCSHIPSFSQVTDYPPTHTHTHTRFFLLKLSEIHSASLCLALCSAVAKV